MIEVAEAMAEKINSGVGKTAVILPLRGLSILDRVDKEFDDAEANFAFFETLKQRLKPEVEVKEVDAHITDTLFADKAAEMLYELVKNQ